MVTEVWNPVTDKFGAWAPIYGTIVTSLIAMLLGVPVSFGIAMFITELCPAVLKRPLGIAIELLAGIPSIIYGIWGLFVLAPVLQQTVQPFLIDTLGQAPLIGSLFAGPPYGIGDLHRRHHPGHHGSALHHLDHPRRLRDGAADAQGIGLWPGGDDLGGGVEGGAALYAGRRHRRA